MKLLVEIDNGIKVIFSQELRIRNREHMLKIMQELEDKKDYYDMNNSEYHTISLDFDYKESDNLGIIPEDYE